ncbi:hypothetical protein ACVIN2_002929 [Bradyrhizobium sp. USDA 3650]
MLPRCPTERPEGILQPFGQGNEALATHFHPDCRAAAKHPGARASLLGRMRNLDGVAYALGSSAMNYRSRPKASLSTTTCERSDAQFCRWAGRGTPISAGPNFQFRFPTAVACCSDLRSYFQEDDEPGVQEACSYSSALERHSRSSCRRPALLSSAIAATGSGDWQTATTTKSQGHSGNPQDLRGREHRDRRHLRSRAGAARPLRGHHIRMREADQRGPGPCHHAYCTDRAAHTCTMNKE